MMKTLKIKGIVCAGLLRDLCFILFIIITFINPNVYAEMKSQDPKNCNIQKGPCTLDLSGFKVTLDIHSKPVKAMNDLTFRVTLTGEPLSSPPYIDLGMQGMKMGPNRVVLKEVGEGIYEGVGVIVRCSSGRRTWRATITFSDLGEVKFIFDVIY